MLLAGKRANKFLRNPIFLNSLLFCVIVIGYFIYDFDSGNFSKRPGNGKFLVYLLILFHYLWILFHNVFLLKKFLFKRKYLHYILLFITCILVLSCLQYYIFKHHHFTRSTLPLTVFNTVYKTVYWGCLYVALRYLLDSRNYYQLETLKKETELQQLKSQLNPHFLFNALNNIYSYLLHGEKHGDELVLKLSRLMRFIVEAADKERIFLYEEAEFLDSYIAFEKERLGSRCHVNYIREIETPESQILPLALFPFVENAFKYGAGSIKQSEISIMLKEKSGKLTLEVANDIINNDVPSTKKGVMNATKRLEHYYPDSYSFTTASTGGKYMITLEIALRK